MVDMVIAENYSMICIITVKILNVYLFLWKHVFPRFNSSSSEPDSRFNLMVTDDPQLYLDTLGA